MAKEKNSTNLDGCMDWDDPIESDGQEYIILEEGDYVFTVTGLERGRFKGGKNTPACNKATLFLEVKTDDGIAKSRTDLIMHHNFEWKLSAFFRSIGMKKRGERVVVDWDKVVGSEGRAHFTPGTYVDQEGNDKHFNNVDHFFDFDPQFFPESDFMKITEEESVPFD